MRIFRTVAQWTHAYGWGENCWEQFARPETDSKAMLESKSRRVETDLLARRASKYDRDREDLTAIWFIIKMKTPFRGVAQFG